MSMLQDLTNGKETSELMVIQDSIQHNGRSLIRCLTNSLAKRVDGIHVFCFDSAPASFLCGFEPAVSNKIHPQDCWSHPLSWYSSVSVNGSSEDVTIHLDFMKVIQRQLDQLGPSKRLAVIIDSLSPLLIHRSLPLVCRMLHQLIYNNQELPGCEMVQVVCLVHGDLHDDVVKASLAQLASTHLSLSPNMSIAPITQEPYGFCSTIHKKKSGKIIEKKEGYSIDENYQLITFGEIANKEAGILQPSGGADLHSSIDPTANLTFNLNLSESERQAKNNLVLPFQVHLKPTTGEKKVGGEGGGAKIYYQPDEADDFDEEDPDDDLTL